MKVFNTKLQFHSNIKSKNKALVVIGELVSFVLLVGSVILGCIVVIGSTHYFIKTAGDNGASGWVFTMCEVVSFIAMIYWLIWISQKLPYHDWFSFLGTKNNSNKSRKGKISK